MAIHEVNGDADADADADTVAKATKTYDSYEMW